MISYLKNVLWINGVIIPVMICFILIKFLGLQLGPAIGISVALFVFQMIIAYFGTPLLRKSIDKKMRPPNGEK